ncbi:hypothetical protein BDV59DRAFT_211049 [Aspergillus ambiguus]|uniref:uncharacterized protein n=1 Tax=Aspergillus ambiguus TaxID=176160 RepID=UPI003CCDACD3
MSIVFGTRLAGPGRSSRYNPGPTPPEATWKTINGVAIPPRPEEPDNCCMSGCVHCVWDDFRDEMEEWAGRVAQAKARGGPATARTKKEVRHAPRAEVASASTSMDDDGGGSEANWPAVAGQDAEEDLFANIPVGIREFMKTEKKLKKKHQGATPTMSISKSETEVILNKANVALARSQRLVASWLPPPTSDELSHTKSEAELQREEDEIFIAVPETLGVGAPLPTKAADGSWNRAELDSNDKLRKQLLGKNYKKVMAARSQTNSPVTGPSGKTKPGVGAATKNETEEDDDDDDEGRTAVVGKRGPSKKRKAAPTGDTVQTGTLEGGGDKSGDGDVEEPTQEEKALPRPATAKGKKKAGSFLDEILADRSKKRKKR